MVRHRNRLLTDALREIRFSFGRFLSIMILCALSVAFLAGLRSTAPDMEYTADQYFDRTHLMDGYVLSTLGLTEEDVEALQNAEGVSDAEGAWSLDATAVDIIVSVRSLQDRMNQPEVVEGRLPQASNECVTEELLMARLDLEIGDTLVLTLEEENEEDLTCTEYVITGVVESPLYVSSDRGTTSLGTGSVDAYVYVPKENFSMDYYTVAYLTFDGLEELNSYGDEYEEKLNGYLDSLEDLAEERAQIRYDSVIGDAEAALEDAEAELEEAQAQADRELAEAWQQLQDARQELDDGWAAYEEGTESYEAMIRDGEAELEAAAVQLQEAQEELDDGWSQYEDGRREYQAGLAEYEDSKALLDQQKEELEARQQELEDAYAQIEETLALLEGTPYYEEAAAWAEEQRGELDASRISLNAAMAVVNAAYAQLEEAEVQLEEAGSLLDSTLQVLNASQQALTEGIRDYELGLEELEQGRTEGQRELEDALTELESGEAEYADGLEEYERGKSEAEAEIQDAERELEDARAALADMDSCEWYVLGRNTNVGVVSYAQDAERIGNLATVFPIIFFLVAALSCLTAVTRMVEEQRTQIGSLKALGFSRMAASAKYLGYAFSASLAGGILGLIIGCTLFPAVIANAYSIMYDIPKIQLRILPGICVIAVAAAVLITTGTALWACFSALTDTPANLMRPKAPKAGKRVFLEYIRPLWNRLSFIWKVTMRNLFRYQRRFWMTVIGIGGCTALIVTGFGLHDSIYAILNKQYDEITPYDASVGLSSDVTEDQILEVTEYLEESPEVLSYLRYYRESVDVSNGGAAQNTTIYALRETEPFEEFIHLRHRKDSEEVTLSEDGVVITEKLAELLNVKTGDLITLETDRRIQVPVTDITENYVYHYVYMTDTYYESLFGTMPEDNSVMLMYEENTDSQTMDEISMDLMSMDGVASYTYIATIRQTFTDSMDAINYAVMVIILAAAALAFVVLFNLTNINITERIRELATLKVLGFYDKEVTSYIYRENIFLTIFGIILGLVIGRFMHAWMVLTVEIDMCMFGRTAPPYAYVIAVVLTGVFAVIVNIAAFFKLRKVDMVESLKTVE